MDARIFILFDGRAKSGNASDATVLDTANTEADCIRQGRDLWSGHHKRKARSA